MSYHFSPRRADADGEDEAYRLHVLRSLNLLDTDPEAEFDALVQATRTALDCPMAVVSLVDDHRQWFKARCGLDATETPRNVAFCSHAIREQDVMIVRDATADPRFATNPLVTGPMHIRFYAGFPIRVALDDDDPMATLGTLCVIDTKPHDWDDAQVDLLRQLGRVAESLVRGRLHVGNALQYARDRDAALTTMRRQHRQLAAAERLADMGSWRLTLDDMKLEWSDQVFSIYDLPVGDVPPLDQALHNFPRRAQELINLAIADASANGTSYDVETDFRSSTGIERRVRSVGERECVDGVPVALIGVFQDVTTRYRMEQVLRRSASEDRLTGIANRAGFDAELDGQMDRSVEDGTPLALMLIDLDGFKPVNDLHGHSAGDIVLQAIAQRLQAPELAAAFPGRLGGDEFALILSDPGDCANSVALTRRLLSALREPVSIGTKSVSVAGTIGICWMEPGLSRRDFVHRADMALYAAKRAGKGIARTWRAGLDLDRTAERRQGSRTL